MAGKFTERIQRFMIGRNGPDEFARFFMWVAFAILIISMLMGDATARSVVSVLAMTSLGYCYIRMFSKNIAARSAENRAFVRVRSRILAPLLRLLGRVRERKALGKDFQIYQCKQCGQRLRVPKGKGSIKVTCPKCGTSFTTKS